MSPMLTKEIRSDIYTNVHAKNDGCILLMNGELEWWKYILILNSI